MEETEIVLGEVMVERDPPYELFIALIKGTQLHDKAMTAMRSPSTQGEQAIYELARAWDVFSGGWRRT